MAPKKPVAEGASTSKRKSDAAEQAKVVKKAKVDVEVPADAPTAEDGPKKHPFIYLNYEMPKEFTLPDATPDTFKICCWNVTSLASASSEKNGNGFPIYMAAEDADIMILTEVKRNDLSPVPQDAAIQAKYPYRYWAISDQKGYAGTAILSKFEPIKVTMDIKVGGKTIKGRMVTLEFPTFFLIGTYVPNAAEGLKRLDEKAAWNKAFEEVLRERDAVKPVVWGGDFNVVLSANDVHDFKKKYNKVPGATEVEMSGYRSQLNPPPESGHQPLVDVWRHLHGPDEIQYSFAGKRGGSRKKGQGWRLDDFVVSKRFLDQVKTCEIRHEIYGPSDHVPVVLEIINQPWKTTE